MDTLLSYVAVLVLCGCVVSETEGHCNETLTADSSFRSFTSPGFPSNYPSNHNCWWLITGLPNERIILESSQFFIEDNVGCRYDNFTLYDGDSSANSTLGIYCGQREINVMSSGNSLFIVFTTDNTISRAGFNITYRTTTYNRTCGGSITATADWTTLTSPGYPYNYFPNERCVWTIAPDSPSKTVVLEVLDLDIEFSEGCVGDYLDVYDGDNDDISYSNITILGQLCGNVTTTLQSVSSSLTLVLNSDMANVSKGFRLRFKTENLTTCTFRLEAFRIPMFLQSPGFPKAYYNDLNCIWVIYSPTHNIRVTLLQQQLDGPSSNCSADDILQILDISDMSHLIFCGTRNTTRSFNVTGSTIIISFRTNNHTGASGFRLQYEALGSRATTTVAPTTTTTETAVRHLTASSWASYLESPNYPQDYPRYSRYTWTIQAASSGYMVRLTVLEMELESFEKCQYDWVQVFDGSSRFNTPSLGKWCGSFMRPTVQSSGRYLTVYFRTDGSTEGSGFRMSYKQTTASYTCGATLTVGSTPQYIFSPGYYGFYPPDVDCVWILRTIDGRNMRIQISHTDIIYSRNCQDDYLQILDGGSSTSRELARICDSQTYTLVSTGKYVRVWFHSDGSLQGGGFQLKFTGGYFDVCKSESLDATMATRYITSPGYPESYPNNVNCDWSIYTRDWDYVVVIEVVESSIEFGISCNTDYVEAFDGSGSWAESLGRWCGSDLPTKRSSGTDMYIKFHSDLSSSRGGFRIAYRAELREEKDAVNYGAIIGGVVGGMIFLMLCACCVACARRGKRNTMQRSSTNVRMVNNNTTSPPQQNVYIIAGTPSPTSADVYPNFNPASFAPPPAYSEVIKDSPARWEAPPSYESVRDIRGAPVGASGGDSVSLDNDGGQDNLGYDNTRL